MNERLLKTVWIVKGEVTDPEAYDGKAKVGDTEWQFSDGPPGNRGSSADYLNIEEGLADHSGSKFYFVDDDEDDECYSILGLSDGPDGHTELESFLTLEEAKAWIDGYTKGGDTGGYYGFAVVAPDGKWSATVDPEDPDNTWICDVTGSRIPAEG